MILPLARALAEELIHQMRPYCERVEVAGSIRRGKEEVGDIEIVCVPRRESKPDPFSLFGEPYSANLLWEWAQADAKDAGVRWIKPGTQEVIDWHVEEKGKYWRALVQDVIKLDLFLATPKNFGLIYLIRTGPAEFSEAVVTHAKRIGRRCAEGFLTTDDNVRLSTPEESDVFRLLNLAYVEPAARTGAGSLRARR